MADTGRGTRGRGRATARAKPPSQGVQEPPRAPGGPPPGLQKPVGPPGVVQKPAPPTTSGRALHRGAGRPLDESTAHLTQQIGKMTMAGSGNGNGGNGSSGSEAAIGRGNMRGKRQIFVPSVKTRPQTLDTKQGITGQTVALQANYFPLISKTDWCLYQYRVDFEPAIDLIGERRGLLRDQKNNIGGAYIFDGTVLYTSNKIPQDVMEVFSARRSDDSQVKITIRLVGDVMVGDHHYIQVFNILTKKALTLLNLQVINRNYYDPVAKVQIPEFCLELWPGYSTTIRQHEQNVLMCANIESKVMRTDTCLNLLSDIARRSARDFRSEFTKQVVGSVVLTDYNNKTYVVSDVNWDESPNSTFDKGGTRVSYISYYKERYNINIKDPNQPLLVSKSRPRDRRAMEQKAVEHAGSVVDTSIILLIPELCRLTGLTDEMRSDFNLMKAMAVHTRIGPADRIERLLTMNRRLNAEARVREEFLNWNMKLADRLVDVSGRLLPQESIVLGKNVTVPSGDECDWTKHLRSNPMFVMPEGGLKRWVIMFPSRVGRDAEAFVEVLYKAGMGMKFNIAEPEYVELNDDRTQSYVESLDRIISNMSPQLIFVVLMNNKADRYSAIKKKSLVDRAVPTQVLLAKNLNKKGVMSIATKVAIQINCKIGGAPWSVQMPLGGLMVIGFDVCHDSRFKGKSYGAMVASLNKPLSRYFSAVSHHSNGEELSNDLAINIVKALQCYRKHNNTLPTHIIIYRDGVGDGQIPYVFEHEVVRIQQALVEMYGQSPKMGFIIVSKKINTRIFENKRNPRPGTVVDDVITLPERYDFFIVSQFVNQGTVSPTSYNVIHDTLALDPDKIQRLTYKMTHCYYNWSGTVRVPAPVQYAHKLAFLVSQSLHRPPNTALEDLLFFL